MYMKDFKTDKLLISCREAINLLPQTLNVICGK